MNNPLILIIDETKEMIVDFRRTRNNPSIHYMSLYRGQVTEATDSRGKHRANFPVDVLEKPPNGGILIRCPSHLS